MNKFIFDGFYDNIIESFGWQNIEIGITTFIDLSDSFYKSKYVVEEYFDIPPQRSLTHINFVSQVNDNELGKVVVYNPDKWKYATFTFLEQQPLVDDSKKNIYTVLHLSLDK